MKRIRDRVAGLDVHRDTVVACCRIVDRGGSVEVSKRQFSTTRRGLGELVAFLQEAAVTTVAMEATGVYWKAPYHALEGLFDELWLCNAQHVKNVPGRKSDLADAEWLADVAAHGMVRPSFVPPPEIRELRELSLLRSRLLPPRRHLTLTTGKPSRSGSRLRNTRGKESFGAASDSLRFSSYCD